MPPGPPPNSEGGFINNAWETAGGTEVYFAMSTILFGDMGGDGYLDVAFGAPGFDQPMSDASSVIIIESEDLFPYSGEVFLRLDNPESTCGEAAWFGSRLGGY